MEQNRGARVNDASVQRLNRSLINQIKKQIDQLDLLIKRHIDQSHELSAKAPKLTSISGVGARTAALLLAQLPELGRSAVFAWSPSGPVWLVCQQLAIADTKLRRIGLWCAATSAAI
jgi:hypothetical protein